MMHEVNMTCQIDTQLGAKAVVCVSNKGRMQKGSNPQKIIKIYEYARQGVHAIR